MSNPNAKARQFLYDRLKANTTFLTALANKWYNRKPPQETTPPFAFIDVWQMDVEATLGTARSDGDGFADIPVVIGRDQALSVIEPVITQIIETLQTTFGSTAKGLVDGCTVTNIFEQPYDIDSDEYMQQIVRVRIHTNSN